MRSEKFFAWTLRAVGLFFVFVMLLHLVLGPQADVLLGAQIDGRTLRDPAVDSQNRFYGTSLAIYGILVWMYLGDRRRYDPVFTALLAMMFVSGLARAVSVLVTSSPPVPVAMLFAAEIVLPPVYALWRARLRRDTVNKDATMGE